MLNLIHPNQSKTALRFGSVRAEITEALASANTRLAEGTPLSLKELTLLANDRQDRLEMVIRTAEQNAAPATHIDAPEDLFEKTPQPQMSDAEAIAANIAAGKAHAELLARTTPVMAIDPDHPLQPCHLNISVTKVAVEDGSTGLSIKINGVPWKFQPESGDQVGSFFIAHDISRHLVLNRNRTSNHTNPSGEYATGQVTASVTALPSDIAHYDGIIANLADQRVEKETGEHSFKQLTTLIDTMKEKDFPVGTQVEIAYILPPPDVVYEESLQDEKHQRVYGLNIPQVKNVGKIPPHQRLALFRKLSLDPACTRTDKTSEALFGQGKVVTVEFAKPYADHPDYQLVHRFVLESDTPGEEQFSEAEKFCRKPDGKLITLTEGKLVRNGHLPVKIGNTGERIYVVNHPSSSNRYSFGGTWNSDFHVTQLMFQLCRSGLKPIYTGYPYEPVRIESVRVNLPETLSDLESHRQDNYQMRKPALQAHLEKITDGYRQKFALAQQYMEELLAAGTLPLDQGVIPDYFSNATYLSRHRRLQDNTTEIFPGGLPKTVLAIQQAMARSDRETLLTTYPELSDLISQDDDKIAPFPPPPFKLKPTPENPSPPKTGVL